MQTVYETLWIEMIERIPHTHQTIVESIGINDNYNVVVDEILDIVQKQKPILISDGHYLIRLNGLTLKCDVPFIKHFYSLRVNFGDNVKNESYYNPQYDNLNHQGQMVNIEVNISLHNKENVLNATKLRETLVHEIQHIYWLWNIITHGPRAIDDYQSQAVEYTKVLSNISKAEEVQLLKGIYYATSKDEINANATELYDIVKNNPLIYVNNAYETLKDHPYVKKMDKIKFFFQYLGDIKTTQNIKQKERWGNAYNTLLQMQNTPQKDFKLLYQRVVYNYKHVVDKFYQVVGKALREESRFHLIIIEDKEIEKELDELLKKLNIL